MGTCGRRCRFCGAWLINHPRFIHDNRITLGYICDYETITLGNFCDSVVISNVRYITDIDAHVKYAIR